MMVFAIESSCDETALACFDPDRGVVREWIHSQIADHQPYGGIVPDLASREHLRLLPHLIESAVKELKEGEGMESLSAIAVTSGPGLAGCLALGIASAKSLGILWDRPVVGVNHLRGHLYSPFMGTYAAGPSSFLERYGELLPHLGLVVSGGNTLLVSLTAGGKAEVVAETVDDAAGEALDKGGKFLGMPYPAGPLIEKRAREGDPQAYGFPRAFADKPDRRFSFSGLKTSLRYTLEAMDDAEWERRLPDLCASYQEAVVDALVQKTGQILRRSQRNRRGAPKWRSLGLSGGVANNGVLRERMGDLAARFGIPFLVADRAHTGDNASMIAFAAHLDPWHTRDNRDGRLSFDPVWEIG